MKRNLPSINTAVKMMLLDVSFVVCVGVSVDFLLLLVVVVYTLLINVNAKSFELNVKSILWHPQNHARIRSHTICSLKHTL